MSETIQTQAGVSPLYPSIALPVGDCPQVLGYNGTLLTTVTVVYRGVTYVQTLTYDGTLLTNVSRFVPVEV